MKAIYLAVYALGQFLLAGMLADENVISFEICSEHALQHLACLLLLVHYPTCLNEDIALLELYL